MNQDSAMHESVPALDASEPEDDLGDGAKDKDNTGFMDQESDL